MEDLAQLTENEAAFVLAQRVGRLASADALGRLSVVPVCYAFDGTRFYSPLDEKPKRITARRLQRVRITMRMTGRASATCWSRPELSCWNRAGTSTLARCRCCATVIHSI